jgi:hypothetical protein
MIDTPSFLISIRAWKIKPKDYGMKPKSSGEVIPLRQKKK